MRVILVGADGARAKLRARLNGTAEIVGEYPTVSAARGSGILADALILPHVPPDEELVEPLTAREIEVLELMAEGLPNKAIATRLGISDHTVKFHVAAISTKFGAANRTEAVRLGIRRGLISL